MWQPDGWGQTRIGLLTPHADLVPEAEFSALAPNGIAHPQSDQSEGVPTQQPDSPQPVPVFRRGGHY